MDLGLNIELVYQKYCLSVVFSEKQRGGPELYNSDGLSSVEWYVIDVYLRWLQSVLMCYLWSVGRIRSLVCCRF